MIRSPLLLLFALLLLAPQPLFAADASAHRQILLVLGDSPDRCTATLYRFRQSGGRWIREGTGIPAVTGEKGMAWDGAAAEDSSRQVKREGDRKSPAGIFPLSLAMGYPPSPPAGILLPYRRIEEGTYCVDDSASPYYNRIVSQKELPQPAAELWKSSERMWEVGERYRLLLTVGYNGEKPKPGAGSCIFLHIWRSPAEGTAGCTAVAADKLEEIVQWLKPDAEPALVQLPREDYLRVWKEWRLPDPALLEEIPAKKDFPLADVGLKVPDAVVDMRYARSDNFTGRKIYDCGRCFLKKETADKLARAQEELRTMGLSLKLWDCYRPLSVQKLFWSIVPDSRFVADPKTGSRHNHGTAVDVTLVDSQERELEMPTPFDDFTLRASHDYDTLSAKVLENRRLLKETMQRAGFKPLESEWWHYDDADGGGALLDVPFGELCR